MDIRSAKSLKSELVTAEASTWFIEFRAGEMSPVERARFYEWLRRSPEHIQAYLEIAEGWAELPTADPEHRLDIETLLSRALESRDENVVVLPSLPTIATRRQRRSWVALAAGLAVVTLILSSSMWAIRSRANTYTTGIGEQRTIRLQDGSTVELNALSSVQVHLSTNAREVDLTKGQAFFRVAKDPVRPFLVHSDRTTVRAVGTQFDVYRKRTGTVVTVLEGSVAVADVDDRNELLVAGQQVTVPALRQTRENVPKRTDAAAATAWIQKRLIFDDTPLADVAEEFNRYNTRRIIIVGAQLQSTGISGVYSSTDPDSLLGFLRAQPNIVLTETDREIRVALRDNR